MKRFVAGLVVVAAAAGAVSAQRPQTFTGVITDDMCPTGDHSQMQMGPTAAECAAACVSAHGAAYVLSGGKSPYKLSSKQRLEPLAGQTVNIVGVLDTKTNTITVNSITRVKR